MTKSTTHLPVIQPDQNPGTPLIFEKIAIVGLGLIGWSIALAARRTWPESLVIGVDNREVLEKAMVHHAIDVAADDPVVMAEADLVILAAPVNQNIQILATLEENVTGTAVVTDVGSTKEAILKKAKSSLPRDISFVGGHPIAGTEKSGFDNSAPNLFRDRPFLVSGAVGSKSAPKTVGRIWKKLGCKVFTVSPKEHDKIFSYLSHFPHVLSFGLNKIVAEKLSSKTVSNYGGDSYKDYSRISSSSKSLWSEIFLSNKNNLLENIKVFKKYLTELETALSKNAKPKTINTIKPKRRKPLFLITANYYYY